MTQPGAEDGSPVVIVGEDGEAVVSGADRNPANQIEQPAKVMRIGTMVKQLLEEVRAAPLDEAGRNRLKAIYQASITELEQGLAPELSEELSRLSLPFGEETPTEAELRIVQAQLVGWLEGLFHGIQTALVAQQMLARVQLEQMRRKAIPGAPGLPSLPGSPSGSDGRTDDPVPDGRPSSGTGHYL